MTQGRDVIAESSPTRTATSLSPSRPRRHRRDWPVCVVAVASLSPSSPVTLSDQPEVKLAARNAFGVSLRCDGDDTIPAVKATMATPSSSKQR
ncbi:hypothetical protein EDB85DRAFT_2152069 [Lactarius pseudohatsudake]|nr:hypothetical protein EDB85DRAFT_2152069 [Lactarius pseudohatsudake]